MKPCNLCLNSSRDQQLGKIYEEYNLILHSNCVIFSHGLWQELNEVESICGFSLHRIKKEIRRGRKKTCIFCRKPGATVKCCDKECKTDFHFICGLENKALYIFFDEYKSYCPQHTPMCFCSEKITGIQMWSGIQLNCCQKNFCHRECIINYIMEAGSTSKCPYCMNEEEFKIQMHSLGIRIPKRMAKYAREVDMSYVVACSATECLCPINMKRLYHEEDSDWELILCSDCGSEAIHKKCQNDGSTWICFSCTPTDKDSESLENPNKRNTKSCGQKNPAVKLSSKCATAAKEKKPVDIFKPFCIPLPNAFGI